MRACSSNITNGIPGTAMPSAFFSADQIWQVVAHVRALARAGSHSGPQAILKKAAYCFAPRAAPAAIWSEVKVASTAPISAS